MSDNIKTDSLVKRILAAMPADLQQAKNDVQHNLKAALQKAFADMDLVTRDEYDVQSALLQRTREKLQELEKQVEQLERQLQKK